MCTLNMAYITLYFHFSFISFNFQLKYVSHISVSLRVTWICGFKNHSQMILTQANRGHILRKTALTLSLQLPRWVTFFFFASEISHPMFLSLEYPWLWFSALDYHSSSALPLIRIPTPGLLESLVCFPTLAPCAIVAGYLFDSPTRLQIP